MARLSREEAAALGIGGKAPVNKYGVSPSSERTWRGKVYDSKAEMRYAQELELCNIEAVEQPRIRLGDDTWYRPDFLVLELAEIGCFGAFYVDVKGAETAAFRRIKKLWPKYARLSLHVVKLKRDRFVVVEIIPPRQKGHPCESSSKSTSPSSSAATPKTTTTPPTPGR